MQSKSDIEKAALVPDHWGYQTSQEDAKRKSWILKTLHIVTQGEPFKRALDIGAYEGWITGDLPAKEIYGFEVSDNAAARFPWNVLRELEPTGKYDLITATGVMYAHYDTKLFIDLINKHAGNIILLCNIKQWEVDLSGIQAKQLLSLEFQYNPGDQQFTQKLRVYQK